MAGDIGPGDLSGLERRGHGGGVIDGNPIAIALFLFMLFTLLEWMTQPGGPLVGCAKCQSNVGLFFSAGNSSTSWMLYLVVPISLGMFVTWLIDQIAATDTEGVAGLYASQFKALTAAQSRSEAFLGARGAGLGFGATRKQFREAAAENTARVVREQAFRQVTTGLDKERSDIQRQIDQIAVVNAQKLQLQRQFDATVVPAEKDRIAQRIQALQIRTPPGLELQLRGQLGNLDREIARRRSSRAQFVAQSRVGRALDLQAPIPVPSAGEVRNLPLFREEAQALETATRVRRAAFMAEERPRMKARLAKLKRDGVLLEAGLPAITTPSVLPPPIRRIERGGKVLPLAERPGRLTKELVARQLAAGKNVDDIAAAYALPREDVLALQGQAILARLSKPKKVRKKKVAP